MPFSRYLKFDLGSGMPSEQDIREICARLLQAEDHGQFQQVLAQLRTTLREHIVDAENRGIHLILSKPKVSKTGTA